MTPHAAHTRVRTMHQTIHIFKKMPTPNPYGTTHQAPFIRGECTSKRKR